MVTVITGIKYNNSILNISDSVAGLAEMISSVINMPLPMRNLNIPSW